MKANIKARHILWACVLSVSLIGVIDALTNSLDIQRYSWDFRYYIAMARDGLQARPMASPFAYRFLTPLLVYAITHLFGLSIETGFRIIAYIGGFSQLLGVFLFTNWFTRSLKGAYIALLVTAFSLYNVKYLFFDLYRPDLLAYVLILLQTYFAFEGKFLPLLFTTMIALQVREFNAIPLMAYLFAIAPAKGRSVFIRELIPALLGLAAALAVPRILIPVSESFQFADFSADGLLRALIAPLVLARDLNFIYTLAAYLLPLLIIAGVNDIRSAADALKPETKKFLLAYTLLTLAFSFLGGTDFYRFSTYLFLPQAILLGVISETSNKPVLIFMVIAVFVFNRIWLPFPGDEKFLDFYGGYATRLNLATLLRMLEIIGYTLIGMMIRKHRPFQQSPRSASI